MKIEIINDDISGCSGVKIWANNKRIQNANSKGFRQYEFDENEIYFIIGNKNYKKYENGQYIFDVAKWILDIVSGNGLKNTTMHQNKFSYEYSNL